MDEIAAQWPSDIGWRVELTVQCSLTIYNNFQFNTVQLNILHFIMVKFNTVQLNTT